MGVILTNAWLADLDPPRVERDVLRIEDDRIVTRGVHIASAHGDEVVDCGGAVVLPGLVNGHTHLYSALAVGMPPPSRTPRDFLDILKLVWWRLDQALDAESIELSARIGALQALRCGTTTLIDHHASPKHIAGSLDLVEQGLSAAGVRGVLCYETTDRHGHQGSESGLEENRRYLEKCRRSRNGRFAAIVGAHASFTLRDQSLDALAELASAYDTGVHIHVAEDPCDEFDAGTWPSSASIPPAKEEPRGVTPRGAVECPLIDRLDRHGLLRPASVFAHGTHLTPDAVARVSAAGLTMAHNARSNMNNAVGYAPVAAFRCPVMLGTDGIGADMFAEAKAAWLIARHQQAGLTPNDVIAMLAAAARRASQSLGVTVGKLEVGAAADVVITDYVPFTPLTGENLASCILFGLSSNCVRGVIVGGEWRLRDRMVLHRDETADRKRAVEVSRALWERMAALPI